MKQSLLNEFTSPFDVRDYIVESINHPEQEFPKELDYRRDLPEAWDQGVDGPCSAYSAAAIKTWHEVKDVELKEKLSPYFVYHLRQNYPQPGMFPRDTMDILRKYGIATDKSFKKTKMKRLQDIPQNVLDEAANYKIQGYAKVNTIDGLKKSLYKNGPAYIAMPVFHGEHNFWKPRYGEKMLGGHALVVVGYNDQGFILRNSWGTNWADKGHTIYPYQDWGAHWEVWTMIDEDSSNLKVVKSDCDKRNKFSNFFKKIFKF